MTDKLEVTQDMFDADPSKYPGMTQDDFCGWCGACHSVCEASLAHQPKPPSADLVEAVAQAMVASIGLDWCHRDQSYKPQSTEYANHDYWLPIARAAIAALPDYRNLTQETPNAG